MPPTANPNGSYRRTLSAFADVVQRCRRAGVLAGDFIEDTLGCLNGIYEERYAASAPGIAQDLKDWMALQKSETVEIKSKTTPAGTIYRDVDWEALYHRRQESHSKSANKKFRKDLNTERARLAAQDPSHWNNIKDAQYIQDRLKSRNLCG